MSMVRTLAALAAWGLTAYSQPASSISYVASIQPSQEERGGSEYSPGGRLTATAITVRSLIRLAYRIQDDQLADAPGWISSKRYDITAKADDNPAPAQQVFLRALLKDRFHLTDHNETRPSPTFALVVARSDGKLGPQLKRSDFDCAAYLQGPHPPPEPRRTPACATNIRNGALSGRAIPMSQLATSLAPMIRRFTVDKTGLRGGFDVELEWTPEQAALSPDAAPGESIFSAIEEQLGLKLVSEKGPVKVLVVDRVEEPSAN